MSEVPERYYLEFTATGRPRSKGSRVVQRVPGQRRVRSAAVQEDELAAWTRIIRTAVTLELGHSNGDPFVGDGTRGYPRTWTGPVLVLARYRLVRPQRLMNTLDQPPATVVPDGDKLERALWDALTGVAFADDRQVVGWFGTKHYAGVCDQAGVDVKVVAVTELAGGEWLGRVMVEEVEGWVS